MRGQSDDALVWDDRRRAAPRPSKVKPSDAASPPATEASDSIVVIAATEAVGRITLRNAAERYGVSTSTLRSWSRSGQIDGILVDGSAGRRWMVTPGSVAERVAAGRNRAVERDGEGSPMAEPGAMLVPRAAWEKLMDQLGNLHEAGQQLAEARERAARYETEAAFLRERLAELRAERDQLRHHVDAGPPASREPTEGWPRRIQGWWRAWGGRSGPER